MSSYLQQWKNWRALDVNQFSGDNIYHLEWKRRLKPRMKIEAYIETKMDAGKNTTRY